MAQQKSHYQHYPNIPGEILFENDKLVVQKFIIEPGQWEGVHAHPGNTPIELLWINLKE